MVSTENKKYKVTHYNDLCYNPANLKFGVICLNKYGDAIFSPIYVTFEVSEKVDVDFIGAYLTRWDFINRALRFQQGTVYERMAVSPEDFLSIRCYLPLKKEQIHISSLIRILDKRIEKQQRFVDALKKYKRGVFEAYISKKIRLSNRGSSYGDWKWVTISEIGKFFGGLSGKTKDDFGHGEDEFITYMNVYKNAFATEDGIMPINIRTGEKQNRIQYGDILFTQSSETIEEVGLSSVWLHDSNPYLNSFCMALRPNSLMQFNPKYLGYIMRSKSVREQIMKEGQGISRINLSGNRILNVGFWCPSLDEQNKIVEIMERLDHITIEIWKRFRKWGGMPTGVTQNVKDLLSSREVENIFENSDYIYMLNQASGDRQILAKQLNISPHQLSYVTHSGEGEGLLFYGNIILPFVDRFPKDTELYRVLTTKPQEVSS